MIEGDPIVPTTPVSDPSNTREDDSKTIQRTPRHALIDALAVAVRDGAASGDAALVKIAARVLLEVTEASMDGAKVIDLNEGRAIRSRPRK